ncbi:MAG: type II toxin-antitoxin system RelE/ParE family toxin [Gammaproteobacteria bacterium]
MIVRKTHEYSEWINGLRDTVARARVLVRVERLIHGNPGDHRNLPGGISELRMDFGPGYRVYYCQRGPVSLLLLGGGDKATQERDIRIATELARDYE